MHIKLKGFICTISCCLLLSACVNSTDYTVEKVNANQEQTNKATEQLTKLQNELKTLSKENLESNYGLDSTEELSKATISDCFALYRLQVKNEKKVELHKTTTLVYPVFKDQTNNEAATLIFINPDNDANHYEKQGYGTNASEYDDAFDVIQKQGLSPLAIVSYRDYYYLISEKDNKQYISSITNDVDDVFDEDNLMDIETFTTLILKHYKKASTASGGTGLDS